MGFSIYTGIDRSCGRTLCDEHIYFCTRLIAFFFFFFPGEFASQAAAVPSTSELAFSEACMLLTKVLLMELRMILRANMSKKTVDQVLALRCSPLLRLLLYVRVVTVVTVAPSLSVQGQWHNTIR